MSGSQPVQVFARVYKGSTIEQATAAYARDAQALAASGYQPAGQSWQAPTTASGIGLLALLVLVLSWGIALTMPYGRSGAATFGPLLIFGGTGLGVLLALGAMATRRSGALTVTYRLVPSPAPVVSPPYQRVSSENAETKICPQCAEQIKAAALICRFCRFEFGPLPPPGQQWS